MKIFVTGIAGYIGSRLLDYLLKAGYQVTGLDNYFYGQNPLLTWFDHPNFKFIKGDVRDKGLVKQLAADASIIIPLAALVGQSVCDKNPDMAWEINYECIKFLANLYPEKRWILPQTNSGYGSTDGKDYCKETDELKPISVYGRSKCEAEKIVADLPNSVIFRLATVFGSSPRFRSDLLVNAFVAKLYYEKNLLIFDPSFKRNFVGIKDVCRAFMFAVGEARLRGIYNLGLPTANLTKLQLADKIRDVLGLPAHVIKEGEGTDPDKRNYLVSNDKILKSGFRFTHELDDGIREVVKVCEGFQANVLYGLRN